MHTHDLHSQRTPLGSSFPSSTLVDAITSVSQAILLASSLCKMDFFSIISDKCPIATVNE